MRVNVWSTANQASPSARRPLWQRLNLDLFMALIALTGFGISIYLTSIEGLLDPQTQTLVVSPLASSSLAVGGVLSSLSSDEFYVFQRIIPAQVVIPFSLSLAFAALMAICTVALWIMASVTLRPSMSQSLRLSED